MASRYRSFSRPAINILKSKFAQKPTSNSIPSFRSSSSSTTFPRVFPQMGAIHSLLPLHSAVSSARLTSCLGIDSTSSRSLSQVITDYLIKDVGANLTSHDRCYGGLAIELGLSVPR